MHRSMPMNPAAIAARRGGGEAAPTATPIRQLPRPASRARRERAIIQDWWDWARSQRHAYMLVIATETSTRDLLAGLLDRLWHIHPFERDQPFVTGIELLVMLQHQINQLLSVDQPKVALATFKTARLRGEGAQRDEQAEVI